jgi:predicted ester cyclase
MRFTRFFTETFPDLRAEVTNAFATQDQVALEGIFRGTNTGSRNLPTGALPATGLPGERQRCFVMQIRNGKITTVHSYYDLTALLEQLGLTSATAQAT